jgi:hypothetical protein
VQLDTNNPTADIVTGGNALYKRHHTGAVYSYQGKPPQWVQLDANNPTVEIAAGCFSTLCKRHESGHVYRYLGEPNRWEQLDDANPDTVAIAPCGSKEYGLLHKLDGSGRIYRYLMYSSSESLSSCYRAATSDTLIPNFYAGANLQEIW